MIRSCYINEFRPLAESSEGCKAVERHHLPPFIDASCRREPDLESAFPSITALCREGRLALLLREGDLVAYVTKDFAYPKGQVSARRFVALLQVKKSWLKHRRRRGLEAHEQAAQWYREQRLPLPSNCMVDDKRRASLDQTDRYKDDLDKWDRGYRRIAVGCGAFHACEKVYCDLDDPPPFTTKQLLEWFGGIPNPREPEPLPEEQFTKMLRWLDRQGINTGGRRRLQNLLRSTAPSL